MDLPLLPKGTYYLTRITADDHAGWLWIVSLLTLVYPLITCFVRLYVKRGIYSSDDWSLFASTVLSTCQHTCLFVGLSYGLGKSTALLENQNIASIDGAVFASEVLFVAAQAIAKLSLALFSRRIFRNGNHGISLMCDVLVAATIGWGVTSLLILLPKCSPTVSLSSLASQQCPGNVLLWQIVTALDVTTEFAIVLVPSYLVMKTQIRRKPKLLAVAAFGMRLPSVIFSVVHVTKLQSSLSETDAGLAVVSPLAWLQIEIAWSLIAASIPSFKAFMKPFDNVSATNPDRSANLSHSQSRSDGLFMGPVKPTKKTDSKAGFAEPQVLELRPDNVESQSAVHHCSRRPSLNMNSVGSSALQEHIIRREVDWEVRYEAVPKS
ncbi:hypothetical protein LTR66_006706 [Elasticomyces elasticus]|nr:hypothetical protein LTR66_006706 [Elasticomyces elasticus]